MLPSIAVTIVALIFGGLGIGVLIGVGEALNNAIAAFAAVSLPFAVLAGVFSWVVPRAWWAIAVALAAPVVGICLLSARMGTVYVPGALWTAACCLAGAYAGRQIKQSRAQPPQTGPG